MSRITLRIIIALFLLCAVHSATAQDLTKQITPPATAPVITGTASAQRVRFTAPSNVVRMQLQIISESGQILFDVSSKGNVLDWSLQDSSGQRLQGSYLTVVTVKTLSGRLSQRIGTVSVEEKQVELKAGNATGLMAAQQLAVGPIEENANLTILKGDEGQPVTVVANDGTDGQIVRDSGALSFRIGDFFSGTDTEQMRLTAEGNLGIGTDSPQAKLDVAGVIRTSKGIEFANGTDGTNVTRLTTTATGSLQQTLADGTVVANVTGTGTQDRLAKWTDNGGTLGDSLLDEAGGGVELRSAAAGVGINPIFINPSNVPGFSELQAYPVSGPNTNLSFAVVPRRTGAANNRAQLALFNTDFIVRLEQLRVCGVAGAGAGFRLRDGEEWDGADSSIHVVRRLSRR